MSDNEDRENTDEHESAPDEGAETEGESEAAERRMRIVCNDGVMFDCGGYKAVDGGVVVFEDEERERTIAFVPYAKLEYVLPVDVVEQYTGRPTAAPQGAATQQQYQQQTVAQRPVSQQSHANQGSHQSRASESQQPNAPRGGQQSYPPSQ